MTSRGSLTKLMQLLGGNEEKAAKPAPRGGAALRKALHRVLDEESVRCVFQPIVKLQGGDIIAYEALARCDEPGLEHPLTLFSTALDEGRCGELGRILRRMAVENCPQYPLFININPNEFNEGWLVRPDDPVFAHGEDVYLEITETVPLSHFEWCHGVLDEIRSKGIRLAVDDLGAGYSNLKYICDLKPDIVKLDRELVAGLHKNDRQQTLVRAIVRMCDDLGAKVVAEGIETFAEFEAVVATGADYGQGFLLARPKFPPPKVPWPPRDD